MIIAQVLRNDASISVEVLGMIRTGDGRKLAAVRAMAGCPFVQCTHGGPCQSDSANIPLDYLTDVAVSVDLAAVRIEVTQ